MALRLINEAQGQLHTHTHTHTQTYISIFSLIDLRNMFIQNGVFCLFMYLVKAQILCGPYFISLSILLFLFKHNDDCTIWMVESKLNISSHVPDAINI
jgi:hypothetical protein